VLYRFRGGTDGVNPQAGLTIGGSGALYGTTVLGGKYGYGTIFQLRPTQHGGRWAETVLYNLGGVDGSYPYLGLLVGKDGALYGTNAGGSATPNGNVFSITPPAAAEGAWTYHVLYTFEADSDGVEPLGIVPWGRNGALLGITTGGGIGYGTVFGLIPPMVPGGAWTKKTLYRFTGGKSGGQPVQGLTIGKEGEIYGIDYSGGILSPPCDTYNGCGTVFALTL
jgi:uncharacterized repeat protein (TIGR03803 family)